MLLIPAIAVLAACGGAAADRPAEPRPTTSAEPVPTLAGARILHRTCSTASIPYPVAGLAVAGGSIWVACRDTSALERYDLDGSAAGQVSLGDLRPWAIAGDAQSLWAIDREAARVVRVDPRSARVVAEATLPGEPVAVAVIRGTAWVLLDDRAAAVRLDANGRVTREVAIGDGPSAALASGSVVYVACHRGDEILVVGPHGGARPLAADFGGPDDAPERLAAAGGSLWVTGRGLDLVPVDPATGQVGAAVEIGAAGLDVATAADRLWAVSATPEAARRGDPVVASVTEVDPSTGVVRASHEAGGGLMLTGFAAVDDGVLVADGLHGLLLRLD